MRVQTKGSYPDLLKGRNQKNDYIQNYYHFFIYLSVDPTYIKKNDQQITEVFECFTTCNISDILLNLYKILKGGYLLNLKPKSLP